MSKKILRNCVFGIFLTFLCLASLKADSGAVTRWTGGGSGSWDEAANWSDGVPEAQVGVAEFLNFTKDTKIALSCDAGAKRIQFVMQRAIPEGDLTFEGASGATLLLSTQDMDGGFVPVLVCSSRGASGSFRIAFDVDVHLGKVLPGSKVIPAIMGTRDFVLSFRKSLMLDSTVNLGGGEDSRIEILGDLSHNGLRFGSQGVVAIEGSGKTSASRGGVSFAGGTIILGRPQAISGRIFKMDGGTVRLGAEGAIAEPGDLTVAGPAVLETGGHGTEFGSLAFSGDGVLHIVLDKNSAVVFADSSSATWTSSAKLVVENFVAGKTSVSFGTNAKGLTASQLAGVTVNGKPASLDAKGCLQPK